MSEASGAAEPSTVGTHSIVTITFFSRWCASYRHRGEVLLKQGRFEKAVADFNKAWALDPKNPIILGLRADSYEALGEHERAVRDRDLIVQLTRAADNDVSKLT